MSRGAEHDVEPRVAAAGPRPQDGDVVVTRERRSALTCNVGRVRGAYQFTVASRQEAVRRARSFAMRNAVDVWYCQAGTYRLLEVYRKREAHG